MRSLAFVWLSCLLAACGTPPLDPWHTVSLASEFTASGGRELRSFDEYLQLEDALFAELAGKVNAAVDADGMPGMSRFDDGSLSDPSVRRPNWNRSFEFEPEPGAAIGGVLMLHGLTDSPYTFRSLALTLAG